MGLRDRFTADSYIPLVAGVRGGDFVPIGTYTPGVVLGGSCTGAGGIGMGKCGSQFSSVDTIAQPTFAFPSEGEEIAADATLIASAFSASGGQTHALTRWLIQFKPAGGGGTRFVIFDSGPEEEDLTELPIEELNLAPGSEYVVQVRYGSNTGFCGPWSQARSFVISTEVPEVGPPAVIFTSAALTGIIDGSDTIAKQLRFSVSLDSGGVDVGDGVTAITFHLKPDTGADADDLTTLRTEYTSAALLFGAGAYGAVADHLGNAFADPTGSDLDAVVTAMFTNGIMVTVSTEDPDANTHRVRFTLIYPNDSSGDPPDVVTSAVTPMLADPQDFEPDVENGDDAQFNLPRLIPIPDI